MKTIQNQKNKAEYIYLEWLCNKVNCNQNAEYYNDLVYWLYHLDFYSILPNDDNRVIDGEKLREQFGINLDQKCSILEMLIGLADRMDYILYDPKEGNRLDKWFWVLINNLKLRPVNIDDEEEDNVKNRFIVKKFIERRYARNGEGGLFPLKRTNEDQRRVEIWYQMMAWINENNL